MNEPTNQPTNRSINQSIYRSVNRSIDRSIHPSINQLVNQWVNPFIYASIHSFASGTVARINNRKQTNHKDTEIRHRITGTRITTRVLDCLIFLVTVMHVGSTCERYVDTDGYFAGQSGSGTCYVTFPRDSRQTKQTWYNARNRCLLEGGDLADKYAINLPLPTDHNYFVGLQRDPFMWIESGKFHGQCC